MHEATPITTRYVYFEYYTDTHSGFLFPSTLSRSIHPRSAMVYRVARVRGYYTVPLQRHGCASRQRISNVRPPENARSLRATPVLGF